VQTIASALEPPRLPHDRDSPSQWMDYVYADGRVLTSRQLNWRNVDLRILVEVRFHIKGAIWGLRRSDCPSTCVELVVFRTAGSDFRIVTDPNHSQRFEVIPHMSWCLGWTDGQTEYLDRYCWKSGRHLERFTLPRDYSRFPDHFHPMSGRALATLPGHG